MRISLSNNQMKLSDFVKLCSIGFACSFGVLFGVVALIMAVISLVTFDITTLISAIGMIVIAPIALGINGAIFGALVFAGIKVYQRFKPIEFV